jgi:hypothetical protein
MAKKKTRRELEHDLHIIRQSRVVEAIVTIVKNFLKYGTFMFVAWMGYLSVRCLAGQATFADVGLKVLGDIKVNAALGWVAGGGGIAYGLSQRKLRRQTIRRLQSRVSAYEKSLDEKRTSSKLGADGGTHPRDQLGVEKT